MEAVTGDGQVMQAAQANARGAKGWLKFLGILSIVVGGLYALTLVGIVFAWMPIWIGVLMVQAGGRAQQFAERGDAQSLAEYTGRIKALVTIAGILAIITLALSIIATIVAIVVGVSTGMMLPQLLEQFGIGS
ncbi:MAG: DUF5362 family protein [bacterium]